MIIHEIQQSTQRILRNYAFLASGELAATERGDIISIERDEQGRLIKYVYTKRGHYQQHEYDNQGRVSRTSFAAGSETYDYNEKGLIIKMTQDYLSSVSITNYQYLAFDDHGNWTERISESDGEVAREIRTITYWSKTTTGSNESLLTRHQGDQIVLDDRITSEEDDRYIDESYRGLLEYTLRGHQNNYKVILGHTRLSSMNQLPDVGYSDIKSHGDTATMLKIGNIEDAVSFHSVPSDSNDGVVRRAQSGTPATAAETKTSAETETSSTSKALSARAMINHPFGVLDREVTAKQTIQQLATHEGWTVELFDNSWIELSPQRGYDLAYEDRIPKCNAWFAYTEEGRLLSYNYTFSFLFGKDVPDVSPQSALRLRAIHFAQLLASELQHQGIDLKESNPNESTENMFSGTAGNLTIQISIKYYMNDSYEETLSIIL